MMFTVGKNRTPASLRWSYPSVRTFQGQQSVHSTLRKILNWKSYAPGGKRGHLSRDCNVPRNEWVKSQTQNGTQGQGTGLDNGPGKENLGNGTLPPSKKVRYQKPKLTLEALQDPKKGLPVVFFNFANRFRKKYKGRGHEGSDLRRLLEMYRDWAEELVPGMEFDDFIQAAAVLGKTQRLKKELRELQNGAINVMIDDKDDGLDNRDLEAGNNDETANHSLDGAAQNLHDAPNLGRDSEMAANNDGTTVMADNDEEDPFDNLDLEQDDADKNDVPLPDEALMDELMDEFG